jgi:hypothetical protein
VLRRGSPQQAGISSSPPHHPTPPENILYNYMLLEKRLPLEKKITMKNEI